MKKIALKFDEQGKLINCLPESEVLDFNEERFKNDGFIIYETDLLQTDLYFLKLQDGNVVFDEQQKINFQTERKLFRLRSRREKECFPIINRGQFWYETLNETQKSELKSWYAAWLNVTETLNVPDKPEWLI